MLIIVSRLLILEFIRQIETVLKRLADRCEALPDPTNEINQRVDGTITPTERFRLFVVSSNEFITYLLQYLYE